jgi:hypothetical protein
MWEEFDEADEMAQINGPSGDIWMVLVNKWPQRAKLAKLVSDLMVSDSIDLLEFIEFINTYFLQEFQKRRKEKLEKYLGQKNELKQKLTSCRNKIISTSKEDKLIKQLTSDISDQIHGVLTFTETLRLDYVINQALAGDTWYTKPSNDKTIADNWLHELIGDLGKYKKVNTGPTKKNQPKKADTMVESKPLPSSFTVKRMNEQDKEPESNSFCYALTPWKHQMHGALPNKGKTLGKETAKAQVVNTTERQERMTS